MSDGILTVEQMDAAIAGKTADAAPRSEPGVLTPQELSFISSDKPLSGNIEKNFIDDAKKSVKQIDTAFKFSEDEGMQARGWAKAAAGLISIEEAKQLYNPSELQLRRKAELDAYDAEPPDVGNSLVKFAKLVAGTAPIIGEMTKASAVSGPIGAVAGAGAGAVTGTEGGVIAAPFLTPLAVPAGAGGGAILGSVGGAAIGIKSGMAYASAEQATGAMFQKAINEGVDETTAREMAAAAGAVAGAASWFFFSGKAVTNVPLNHVEKEVLKGTLKHHLTQTVAGRVATHAVKGAVLMDAVAASNFAIEHFAKAWLNDKVKAPSWNEMVESIKNNTISGAAMGTLGGAVSEFGLKGKSNPKSAGPIENKVQEILSIPPAMQVSKVNQIKLQGEIVKAQTKVKDAQTKLEGLQTKDAAKQAKASAKAPASGAVTGESKAVKNAELAVEKAEDAVKALQLQHEHQVARYNIGQAAVDLHEAEATGKNVEVAKAKLELAKTIYNELPPLPSTVKLIGGVTKKVEKQKETKKTLESEAQRLEREALEAQERYNRKEYPAQENLDAATQAVSEQSAKFEKADYDLILAEGQVEVAKGTVKRLEAKLSKLELDASMNKKNLRPYQDAVTRTGHELEIADPNNKTELKAKKAAFDYAEKSLAAAEKGEGPDKALLVGQIEQARKLVQESKAKVAKVKEEKLKEKEKLSALLVEEKEAKRELAAQDAIAKNEMDDAVAAEKAAKKDAKEHEAETKKDYLEKIKGLVSKFDAKDLKGKVDYAEFQILEQYQWAIQNPDKAIAYAKAHAQDDSTSGKIKEFIANQTAGYENFTAGQLKDLHGQIEAAYTGAKGYKAAIIKQRVQRLREVADLGVEFAKRGKTEAQIKEANDGHPLKIFVSRSVRMGDPTVKMYHALIDTVDPSGKLLKLINIDAAENAAVENRNIWVKRFKETLTKNDPELDDAYSRFKLDARKYNWGNHTRFRYTSRENPETGKRETQVKTSVEPLLLTKGEVLDVVMGMGDIELKNRIEKGNGYSFEDSSDLPEAANRKAPSTEAVATQALKSLKGGVELAINLREFYQIYGEEGIQPWHTATRGVRLNTSNKTYSGPAPVENSKEGDIDLLAPSINVSSMVPGSIQERENQSARVPFTNALDKGIRHIGVFEHAKALTEKAEEVLAVVRNQRFREVVEDVDPQLMKSINVVVDNFFGLKPKTLNVSLKFLDWIRANTATALVGGKIIQIPAQLTSYRLLAHHMPEADLHWGIKDYWENKDAADAFLDKNSFWMDRQEDLYANAINQSSNEYLGGDNTHSKLAQAAMYPVELGDTLVSRPGAWAYAKWYLKSGKAEGETTEVKEDDARAQAAFVIKSTQSSSAASQQTPLEIETKFGKFIMLFHKQSIQAEVLLQKAWQVALEEPSKENNIKLAHAVINNVSAQALWNATKLAGKMLFTGAALTTASIFGIRKNDRKTELSDDLIDAVNETIVQTFGTHPLFGAAQQNAMLNVLLGLEKAAGISSKAKVYPASVNFMNVQNKMVDVEKDVLNIIGKQIMYGESMTLQDAAKIGVDISGTGTSGLPLGVPARAAQEIVGKPEKKRKR